MNWLDRALPVLTFLAAIGSGLIAGVFYGFSTFVMRALAQRPAAEGLAAMQAINVAVINPLFLVPFLGTAVLCLAAAIGAVTRWGSPGAAWLLVGAVLYLVGTLGVTMVCNVPLNDALAKVSAGDADAAVRWADYVRRWTLWNHVRTVAAVAALAAFIFGLLNLRQGR